MIRRLAKTMDNSKQIKTNKNDGLSSISAEKHHRMIEIKSQNGYNKNSGRLNPALEGYYDPSKIHC